MVSRPGNACVQVENGNSIRICRVKLKVTFQVIAIGKPHNGALWRSEFNFMIINFSIERYSITLINEDK